MTVTTAETTSASGSVRPVGTALGRRPAAWGPGAVRTARTPGVGCTAGTAVADAAPVVMAPEAPEPALPEPVVPAAALPEPVMPTAALPAPAGSVGDGGAERLLALRGALADAPVERVPIARLRVAGSPRSAPEDPEYARSLADVVDALPPVVVHRATMTVVDGIHRLRAAELRGRTTIQVRYVDGSAADARVLAVALNVTHGLPLTLAERTAAAERILAAHPEWSDRAVASLAGLSPGKTAAVRGRLLGAAAPGARRIGRDGRARPVDPAAGRERAAALLRKSPTASLRQIAREAGISPATVADVRTRMNRTGLNGGSGGPGEREAGGGHRGTSCPPGEAGPELARLHGVLRRDPALRFSETGRSFLRLLEAGAVLARHREGIAAGLPPHCKASAARLAQAYAESWQRLAEELQ